MNTQFLEVNIMNKIDFERIDKNESCPCGSEFVYKKCCINRKDQKLEDDELLNNSSRMNAEVISNLRSSKFSACLHPTKQECDKRIIDAHTLQNNGVLSFLAEKGNVVVIEPGVDKKGIVFNYKEKSKKKATTFTGFCSYHDREVFKPIETEEYNKENVEHNFIFAYRIFAYEYYKKHVAFKAVQKMIRKKPSILKIEMGVRHYRGYQLGIKDMDAYKEIFNNSLLNKDYSCLFTHVIEFDYRLPFATCFAFSPYFDFNGDDVNLAAMINNNEDRLKLNFVTVLPQENKSYILYSWLREDDEHFKSIKRSLETFSKSEIKRYFNNLIPEYSEHIVFAPRYWNNLTENQIKMLETRLGNDFPVTENDFMILPDYLRNKTSLSKRPIYNLFKNVKFD